MQCCLHLRASAHGAERSGRQEGRHRTAERRLKDVPGVCIGLAPFAAFLSLRRPLRSQRPDRERAERDRANAIGLCRLLHDARVLTFAFHECSRAVSVACPISGSITSSQRSARISPRLIAEPSASRKNGPQRVASAAVKKRTASFSSSARACDRGALGASTASATFRHARSCRIAQRNAERSSEKAWLTDLGASRFFSTLPRSLIVASQDDTCAGESFASAMPPICGAIVNFASSS